MPPASRATKPGTRKLSEVAKHLSAPTGITATGWPDVEKTCRLKMGITFDDWQDGAGRLILAKRADGNLAATIDGVGLSVCRQVGKTYLVGALAFALCVNIPGLLVIWSAHHSRTHGETFLALQGFAKRAKVAAHVRQIRTGSNVEAIEFHNGSRILFGARERGFGRGIPGVDVLIFDEAQILSDRAMSNMLATLNTSKFGLQLYIGTPPKPEDMSEAFTRMRDEALAGTLTDGAWIEFGADDRADENDRAQWRKANPSFPTRTPVQSMLRLKRKLTNADWRREGLGIWDSADDAGNTVYPLEEWKASADPASAIAEGESVAWSVDVSWNRSTAYVAIAGRRADGLWHSQVVHTCPPPDVAAYIGERVARIPSLAVGLQASSAPVSSLLDDITTAVNGACDVVGMTATQLSMAFGLTYDAIKSEQVRHIGDPSLDRSFLLAVARSIDAAWVIDRKKSPIDVANLVAVTNALWLAATHRAAAPVPELNFF